jgi:hypothetical protein
MQRTQEYMSNSFILVATVTPKNINWNIQFSEAVDVAVTEVIRKALPRNSN